MAKLRTHYDNLKVARNAPDSVIKAAYKALCQQYHPDKFQGSKEEGERIIKIVKASYVVLLDPDKRAKHDRWIDEQEANSQNQFNDYEEPSEQNYQQIQDKRISPKPEEPFQSTNSKPNITPPNTNIENRSKLRTSGWLRFFARLFDVWWEAFTVTFFIVYILRLFLPGFDEWLNSKPTSVTQVGFLCFPLAFLLDAMLYRLFGNTPGKAWIGLKVKNAEGYPLNFFEYLGRNLKLYVSGFAFGLPIIGLFPMVNQSIRLRRGQQASYDEATGFRVYEQPVGWFQKTTFGIAFICLLLIISLLNILGRSSQQKPSIIPNQEISDSTTFHSEFQANEKRQGSFEKDALYNQNKIDSRPQALLDWEAGNPWVYDPKYSAWKDKANKIYQEMVTKEGFNIENPHTYEILNNRLNQLIPPPQQRQLDNKVEVIETNDALRVNIENEQKFEIKGNLPRLKKEMRASRLSPVHRHESNDEEKPIKHECIIKPVMTKADIDNCKN
ncbi:DnaJ domain-containing protein [Methyloglobulus sp.]|uniref:DnaJ domain-containing protein n=1 Tax=Methyloglobulus sp. TaxID=2518622 RepID=UPI0032B836F0